MDSKGKKLGSDLCPAEYLLRRETQQVHLGNERFTQIF